MSSSSHDIAEKLLKVTINTQITLTH